MASRGAADDGALVRRAKSDPAAFAALFRRHYDGVFRYAAHRLFDRPAAEDVTSTVFLKALEKLHRFRGSDAAFKNWLYKIATNEANTWLRKRLRQGRLIERAASREAGVPLRAGASNDEADGRLGRLRDAVLSLPPKYQTVITLRFFENLSHAEIAEILSAKPSTVRSRLTRGLRKLEARMTTAGMHEKGVAR